MQKTPAPDHRIELQIDHPRRVEGAKSMASRSVHPSSPLTGSSANRRIPQRLRWIVSRIHLSISGVFCFALLLMFLLPGMRVTAASGESGTYVLYHAGERIGDEQFVFAKTEQGRRLTTTTKFKLGSKVVDQEVTLDLDAKDRPVRVQAKDLRGTTAATFDEETIEIAGSAKDERPWPRDYLLRYPNAIHHIAIILAHAPAAEKGSSVYAETFSGAPVLVLNKGTEAVQAGERTLSFRRFWIVVRGERSVAWTDAATGEMVKFEAPSIGLQAIAGGSEEVAKNLVDSNPAHQ